MGRLMQPVILLPYGRDQMYRRSPKGLLASIFNNLQSYDVYRNDCGRGCSVPGPSLCHSAINRPWILVLDMTGFDSEEINVKIKDSVLSVYAKHEEIFGGDLDIIERKRTVKIPEGVNVKEIACFVNRKGQLVITAPFSTTTHIDRTQKCELKPEPEIYNSEKSCDKLQHQENSDSLKETVKCETETVKGEKHTEGQCDKFDEQKQCDDLTNDSEHITTKKFFDELHPEKNCTEKQQLGTECKEFTEPADKGTEDCKQFNVPDDLLPSNTECHLTGDFESLVQQAEESDGKTHDGEDVGTDTVLKKEEHLKPLTESTDIVEKDSQKYFCAKINLENFPTDSIRVLCGDKTLSIDAKHEWDDSGVKRYQEFHRQYLLPNNASENDARAFISDSGYFTVNVPIKE